MRKRRESVQPDDSIGEHFKRMEDDNTKSKGFLQSSVVSKGKKAEKESVNMASPAPRESLKVVQQTSDSKV